MKRQVFSAIVASEKVEIGVLVRTRSFFTWMPFEVTSLWKRDPGPHRPGVTSSAALRVDTGRKLLEQFRMPPDQTSSTR